MANFGKAEITLGLKDEMTARLRKAGTEVKKFGKLTDDQMRKVEKSSEKLKKFGGAASAMGKQMSMKMTLPIVAAGGAALKMASDFESSMTKIQSLVGRSEEEVQGLTKTVLKLSGETSRAPQELADAMFFITSAGIEGADAASVLEASAKAAAVGLGEAATIADLATSAMNAYGKENLGASDATDVMVAAVREGKLEASELAGSMGRVLPIASAMGVSFNEVGAAFASLSRTGTNAAEAATQVRGIMSSLLRPTKEAEDALTGMGLSSEGLREQLKEKGLLSTLKTLADEFDGNAAASASVFGNVRALSGVMDLMGKNVAGTEAIFASMNNTLGATDKAFAVTSQTTEFKMNQAISDFKVAMIAVGQEIIPVVLPIIQKLGEFIGKVVKAFGSLSGPMKTVIVVVGLMVAALGPLLMVIGMVLLLLLERQ
jgi:TP901 family phage tail tape measure protein